MKKMMRVALGSVALMAGMAVAGASRANAQVSFQGTFPVPHGSVSLSIGDPAFQVGAYVPYGYPVAVQPGYGYGFTYHHHWVPARPYGSRWVVVGAPYYGAYAAPVYAPYGYSRGGYTHSYYTHGYSHNDQYNHHEGNPGWNHGNHGENHGNGNHGHGNNGHDRH